MTNLTFEEQNLLAIYTDGTREGTIAALQEMRGYLEQDETELLLLTDSAIEKLGGMRDAEYGELDLFPEFED